MKQTESTRWRRGFTLLEIMTSVTLSLMLMYAVARIFSRVGGSMNETMSTMEMTNALRNAKQLLSSDLSQTSLSPIKPTPYSARNEGFFSYSEGLGAPIVYTNLQGAASYRVCSIGDIALDTERYQSYKNRSDLWTYNDHVDSTVGDTDDILHFTVRAQDGNRFRGRYVSPVYDRSGAIVAGRKDVFESEYAEVIWFLRGTTLYRRVLPLMDKDQLHDSLIALYVASQGGAVTDVDGNVVESDPDLAGVDWAAIRAGFGFYRYYDVSVHQGLLSENNFTYTTDGPCVVANSTGDLSNRQNRYFYWSSCAPNYTVGDTYRFAGRSPHGYNGAWYWLRMATLQESARSTFQAGYPFGSDNLWNLELTTTIPDNTPIADRMGSHSRTWTSRELPASSPSDARRLPFIDFWNNPNCWNEVDYETGDIVPAVEDDFVLNNDVVLTNVISFDVKAWDPSINAYVDLGSDYTRVPERWAGVSYLRSLGFYSGEGYVSPLDVNPAGSYTWLKQPLLPGVYDTWTEQYERDLFQYNGDGLNDTACRTGGRILDGAGNVVKPYNASTAYKSYSDIPDARYLDSTVLRNYPPPYDVELKSLQVQIRVFDPRSKHIRQTTFVVDLSNR